MRTLAVAVVLLGLTPLALPQGRGEYFNVESPQVNPLAMATMGDATYLLVCNTPDNSVEVFEVDAGGGTSPVLTPIRRIPVGLEPISCRLHTATTTGETRLYVANFLGDSITSVRLQTIGGGLSALVERTVNVGDEPMDIEPFELNVGEALVPLLLVTKQSSSTYGIHDALTLEEYTSGGTLPPAAEIVLALDRESTYFGGTANGVFDEQWALNEPRTVRVLGKQAFFLGHKGGDIRNGVRDTSEDFNHDLDLVIADLTPLGEPTPALPTTRNGIPAPYEMLLGFGSTNFNMKFASNGDLFVVGMEAQNWDDGAVTHDNRDEVRREETQFTGLVRSNLIRIPGPVTSASTWFTRDLNREGDTTISDDGLTMSTDLALFENEGVVTKVYVTAMGSNALGVLTRNGTDDISQWIRTRINLDPAFSIATDPVFHGPRAVILHEFGTGERLLFVMNRVDNTVSVVDANADQVRSIHALQHPVPDWIRDGRQLLYDARLSKNGFSSCASCHIDGRTDALAWRLGNPDEVLPLEDTPTEQDIFDRMGGPGFTSHAFGSPAEYNFFLLMLNNETFDPLGPDDKREMVTQTLQGLMNYEVDLEPDAAGTDEHKALMRRYYSNAPFHWRGDKRDIPDFEEVFATLFDDDPGADPNNTGNDMELFEEFIFSIAYPPNPQQATDRMLRPTNSAGDPIGAVRGQELFHIQPILQTNNRTCAQCHSLPEGSNNRFTITARLPQTPGYVTVANEQATESAALRGMIQREGLVQSDSLDPNGVDDSIRKNHFGLTHAGTVPIAIDPNRPRSINTFAEGFRGDFPVPGELEAVSQYQHEFDWGVAPGVGQSVTVYAADGNTLDPIIEAFEAQAGLGNTGLAVHVQLVAPDGTVTSVGSWYSAPLDRYVREDNGTVLALDTLAGLKNFLSTPDDQLTFHQTPLGSERRMAAGDGLSSTSYFPNWTPTAVTMQPMRPIAMNEVIPTFTDNIIPGPGGFDFQPVASNPNNPASITATDDPFPRILRTLQASLMSAGNDYGIDELRHDAPRRLRITGRRINPGAVLRLYTPHTDGTAHPNPPSLWTETEFKDPTLALAMEFPLYVTGERIGGRSVWETAVEIQPITYYTMMMGGPEAPAIPGVGGNPTQSVQEVMDWLAMDALDLIEAQTLPQANFNLPVTAGIDNFENTDWTAAQPFAVGGPNDPDNPFQPDLWNWHWIEVVNPNGTEADAGGPVQLTLELPPS